MVSQRLVDEVFSLPLEDRLELLDRLQTNVDAEITDDIPDWHKKIIEERLADLEQNPDAGIPWEQVQREIKEMLAAKRQAVQ